MTKIVALAPPLPPHNNGLLVSLYDLGICESRFTITAP
jgi:hypothetical protein